MKSADRCTPRALLHRLMLTVELTPLELSMLIEAMEARAVAASHHSSQVDFADFLFRRVAELREAFR